MPIMSSCVVSPGGATANDAHGPTTPARRASTPVPAAPGAPGRRPAARPRRRPSTHRPAHVHGPTHPRVQPAAPTSGSTVRRSMPGRRRDDAVRTPVAGSSACSTSPDDPHHGSVRTCGRSVRSARVDRCRLARCRTPARPPHHNNVTVTLQRASDLKTVPATSWVIRITTLRSFTSTRRRCLMDGASGSPPSTSHN